MILEETIDGISYLMDTELLPKIEFPFYEKYGRSAYNVQIDKSVYLPLRFRFLKAKKDDVVLKASITLPEEGKIEAKDKIQLKDLFEAMKNARINHTSLFAQPVLASSMKRLSDAVYGAVDRVSDTLLFSKKENTYPCFLLQKGKLIGITDKTSLQLEDGTLKIEFKKTKGPFLRAFHKESDRKVSVIMLDDDGEETIFAARAYVRLVSGNDISMDKERNSSPSEEDVRLCCSIYQKYHENFMEYFIDNENEKEDDLFELIDVL